MVAEKAAKNFREYLFLPHPVQVRKVHWVMYVLYIF